MKNERSSMKKAEVVQVEVEAMATVPYSAEQVVTAYGLAINAVTSMVRFGAMLVEIDMSLSRQTHKGGCFQTGETLKAWLDDNCKGVDYGKALKFKRLAEGLQRELCIPDKIPLSLAMPGAELPEGSDEKRIQKFQRQVESFLDGKSARQLEFDFGFRSIGESNRGGDRRSGSAMTEEEKHLRLMDLRKANFLTFTQKLLDLVSLEEAHLTLDEGTLTELDNRLSVIADAIRSAKKR